MLLNPTETSRIEQAGAKWMLGGMLTAVPTRSSSCFHLFLVLHFYLHDFSSDIRIISGQLSKACHDAERFGIFPLFDQKTWRFDLKEGQDKDDAREHDM